MLSEVLSFFSIPILYRIDLNQKRKDILHVLAPVSAFLLGKTWGIHACTQMGLFFSDHLVKDSVQRHIAFALSHLDQEKNCF